MILGHDLEVWVAGNSPKAGHICVQSICSMAWLAAGWFVVVCRYYADTIVGLLQDVALQAAIHPYVEPDAGELEVPPPMFSDNQETAANCLRGDLLQQKVHESGVSVPTTCVM